MSQQQQQREETDLNEAKKMFFNSFKPTSSDKSKPFTSSPLPGSDLRSSVSIEMSDKNISSDNVNVKVIDNHNHQSEAIDASDVEKASNVTESDSLLKDHHDIDNSRPSMTTNPSNHIPSNETTKAVQISNLYFSYGKEKVLRGLDLNVNAGTIYGLLGASGCGKTTILRIIIGLIRNIPSRPSAEPNLAVFGERPGSSNSLVPGQGVGYMPQEIALCQSLTVEELMIYFARLNQMKRELIRDKIDKMIELLRLPRKTRMISTLSGGQKRRASLAIALLHEPPLLILDEPTVGVDPLLRETIWSHMKDCVSRNRQTIIITTHYIDEAKQTDCVGLLRNGKLLIEDHPAAILQRMRLESLEEAYLQLSRREEEKAMRRRAIGASGDTSDEEDEHVEIGEQLNQGKDKPFLQDSSCAAEKGEIIGNGKSACSGVEQPISGKTISRNSNNRSSIKSIRSNTSDVNQNFDYSSTQAKNPNKHVTFNSTSPSSSSLPLSLRRDSLFHRHLTSTNKALNNISAIIGKHTSSYKRNLTFLMFQFVTAVFELIIIYYSIGKAPKGTPIAIYNPDMPSTVSESFLANLNPDLVKLNRFDTLEAAVKSVERGENWAVLSFPANYTRSIYFMYNEMQDKIGTGKSEDGKDDGDEDYYDDYDNEIEDSSASNSSSSSGLKPWFQKRRRRRRDSSSSPQLDLQGKQRRKEEGNNSSSRSNNSNSTTNSSLSSPLSESQSSNKLIDSVIDPNEASYYRTQIEVIMDNTDYIMLSFIKLELYLAVKATAEKFSGVALENLKSPFVFREPPVYGKSNPEMIDFIMPGLLLMVAFSRSTGVTGMQLFAEKKDGIIERSLAAGAKSYQFIFSLMASNVMTTIVQIVLQMTIAFLLLGTYMAGNVFLAFALILAESLMGMSYGLWVSVICKEETHSLVVAMVTLLPAILVSGVIWPIQAMPDGFKFVSYFLPFTYPCDAIRCVVLRGWGIAFPVVQLGFLTSFAWMAVFFVTATYIFHIKN